MFSLHAMGLQVKHTGDFMIDRPTGSGDRLLIIFKTNAYLTIGAEQQTVEPDSAIIFDKGTPQLYKSFGESYVNHFMHFDSDESADICYDRLLTGRNIKESEDIMQMISREQLSASAHKEEYISSLIRILLMKLSEEGAKPAAASVSHYSAKLNELRAEIYSNPAQFHSVAQLAGIVNVSPSRFQQIYKQQFGISCYEDILSAKIKTAQYYLTSTSFTVKEIAMLCGYSNEICFMHRFKSRTGVTPSQYRG